MFYPHVDYCCEVWGKFNTQCLFLLQKKILTHSFYLVLTNDLFYRLNILYYSVTLLCINLIFFDSKSFMWYYLLRWTNFLTLNHFWYEMRSIRNFAGTIYKTNMKSFHIINVSMNLWNKLSNDVKIMSFVLFIVYIKTMFINMNGMS